ncbi:MAG TPA: DUF4197 domain-containing protein [Gammaproteobacteria bacterium]|jgi:hypothetical protein|nr:DUF4197 domain-containing protein [Gammaproteobacteria bacterium]
MTIMKKTVAAIGLVLLTACSGGGDLVEQIQKSAESVLGEGAPAVLSDTDIAAGLKEALNKGTGIVVANLGKKGGFATDQTIRIPLPQTLVKAKGYADKVGLGDHFVELEDRLNAAAELATPKAKALFVDAIKDMSLGDARQILQGSDDAATRYFEGKMSDRLRTEMEPIVASSLDQVGAVRSFNSLLEAYKKIPFAPEVEADLTGHVVSGGVDGIFHYVAEEEKAIRDNPAARTTELLQRVFGAQE